MKMLDKLCYNMRKIFYSLAVVFVVLVGIVGMQESFATECYAPNLERNFVDADVVFSGTVIGIDALKDNTATVAFKVIETWKGETNDVMDIVANIEPLFCGVNFQSVESYVVYANELDGKFFTNADYGTQSFSRAMNLVGGYERWSAFPEIIAEKEKCLEKRLDLAAENGKFMSPKMQISCEVPKHNVQCNLGLQLIFKSSDNSSACVKTETTEKLIERGWANPTIKIISELNTNLEKDYRETGSVDPPVVGIRGVIFDNDTAILYPWYRFDSVLDVDLNESGEITALYLDSNQNIIAQTGFDLIRGYTHSAIAQDFGSFSFRIPVVDKMDQIVLQRDGQTVATRQISPNDPTVTLLTPNGGELFIQGDIIDVTWQSSDLDGDEIFHIVMFSQNGGLNWILLATDLVGNQFNFTAPQNIQSDLMLIRVTAMDGINTSEDISDSFFAIFG